MSSVFLGWLLCMMDLLPKGVTRNGFILPQETDRSIFHWMAVKTLMPSTVSSAQAMARKDYRPWTMGPLELAAESIRLHSVKGRNRSENRALF